MEQAISSHSAREIERCTDIDSYTWSPMRLMGVRAARQSWKTSAKSSPHRRRRSRAGRSGIEEPSYQMSPRVTMPNSPSCPMAAFTNVDLPLPDSPTMHTTSPGMTGNDTSCTTGVPL